MAIVDTTEEAWWQHASDALTENDAIVGAVELDTGSHGGCGIYINSDLRRRTHARDYPI